MIDEAGELYARVSCIAWDGDARVGGVLEGVAACHAIGVPTGIREKVATRFSGVAA